MPYSSCGGVQVLKSRKVITDDICLERQILPVSLLGL